MKTTALDYLLPLAWTALIWLSLKNLRSSFQIVFEGLIEKFLTNRKLNRLNHYGRGLILSALSLSSAAITVFLTSMQSGGLLSVEAALAQALGAHVGSSFYILFSALGEITWLNLILALSFLLLIFIQEQRSRNVLWLLFSMGVIGLAQNLLIGSLDSLHLAENLQWLVTDSWGAYIGTSLLGLALSLLFRSSLLINLFGYAMIFSNNISLNNFLFLLFVTPIGEAIYANFVAKMAIQPAKRVSLFNLILKSMSFFLFCLVNWKVEFQTSDSAFVLIFYSMGVFLAVNFSVSIFVVIFLKFFSEFLEKILPEMEMRESYQLQLLGPSELNLPSISLSQIYLHLRKMKSVVDRMFRLTQEYLDQEEVHPRMLAKIKDYERITDNMGKESKVFEKYLAQKILTTIQAQELGLYDQIASHLESIADYVDKLAIFRTDMGNTKLTDEVLSAEIKGFTSEVFAFYGMCTEPLESDMDDLSSLSSIDERSRDIKQKSQSLRLKVIKTFENNEQDEAIMLNWLDTVYALRKIRGHSVQVRRILHQF